jgi:hypothetical protein
MGSVAREGGRENLARWSHIASSSGKRRDPISANGEVERSSNPDVVEGSNARVQEEVERPRTRTDVELRGKTCSQLGKTIGRWRLK